MKLIKTFTAAAAAVCCLAVTSQATLLLPGTPPLVVIPGIQAAPAPTTSIADSLVVPLTGAFSGTMTSWVVKNDPANPLGGPVGELSFYYQLSLTAGSTLVERFTTAGYNGVNTALGVDVETINLGAAWDGALTGGVVPTTTGSGATRTPLAADGGNVIGFEFPGTSVITAGLHTELLVIHTTSLTWVRNAPGAVIDGSSANMLVLAPVPEPTTMIAGALLLLPFGASTLRFVRKSRLA